MISPILPLYKRAAIEFDHGTGVYLYSKKGQKYLDFAAGNAVNSLGHCHPRLVDALTEQSKKFWHLSNRYQIPGLLEFSKTLVNLSFADTCFVANSGAEAVGAMVKMCRCYFSDKKMSHKYRIITLNGAFHGRALGTTNAAAEEGAASFEPSADGFDSVRWNDIDALKKAITPNTAGILLELLQGEGGMRELSPSYVKELRKLCDEHNLLLLDDEVQCGMGRIGTLFAYEKFDIKPDLMALGKGLGCGFPVSACLATEKVGKAMKLGMHGSTFGGNPLAMAVGNAVLEIMTTDGFLGHVNYIAAYLEQKLNILKLEYPDMIEEITGMGLMRGIKMKASINLEDLNDLLLDNWLLLAPAANNVIRLTPPLIIERAHCDEFYSKFSTALKRYKSPLSKVKGRLTRIMRAIKEEIG